MNFKWEPLGKKLNEIGVDFDDTIATNSGFPDFIPGEPLPGAVYALQAIDGLGYKIVIYTARHWADRPAIEKYCRHYGIPFVQVICGKPLFLYIIDDKNIAFHGNWRDVLVQLV